MNGIKIKNHLPIMIISWMILSCLAMQYVEMIISPDYWIKAVIKLILFVVCPLIYSKFRHTDLSPIVRPVYRKNIGVAFLIGLCCVVSILVGYLMIRPFIDEVQIRKLLGTGAGVSVLNFVPVALYIAFINSLVEEFFFRGLGYIILKRYLNPKVALVFSSLCFSLYHIGIIDGWFNMILFTFAVLGLAVVGGFFNLIDGKYNSVFPSWVIHMLCNFGINTVGLIIFRVIAI